MEISLNNGPSQTVQAKDLHLHITPHVMRPMYHFRCHVAHDSGGSIINGAFSV